MQAFFSNIRPCRFGFFLLTLFGIAAAVARAGEPPRERRIVFLGDSITQAGGYVRILEAALIAAQPEVVREIIPLGLASETVSGLSEKGHAGGQFPRPDLHERLDRVLAKTKPELVLACYGMNDGIYYPPDASRMQAFQDGMRKLHQKVTAAGARIIHLTPPVFDPLPIKDHVLPDGLTEYPQPWQGYNTVLDQYSAWLLGMRAAEGWEVLDIHGPMNAALAERRVRDPKFTFANDGVHAGAEGHVLMAQPVLEAWGLKAKSDGTPDVPDGRAILDAVGKKYAILSPAWLSEVGHLRPGIEPGLPISEAQTKAAVFDEQARGLARKSAAGKPAENVPAAALQRFEYVRPQMGSPFKITLYAADQAAGDAAAEAGFARAQELNGILSDYQKDSELSKLSASAGSGAKVPVSGDLWKMLELSLGMAEKTDGALDITVGPLVDLWRAARRSGVMPPAEDLAMQRERTGWRKLKLDPAAHTAELTVPHMRLDLGGVAKGFVADEVLKVLAKRGVTSALVAASGDIAAGDAPPGRPGWRVMTTALDVPDAPPARGVWLRNSAISTSGDTWQRVEIGGVRYSHIVDPKTGIGITDHSLVTVLGPNGTTTDLLETTITVLGPEKGLKLIAGMPGTAVFIVRIPDGKIESYQSPNWEAAAQNGVKEPE